MSSRRFRPRLAGLLSLAALALCLGAPRALRADAFPPITPEEWAVESVAGDPSAGAVVLSKVGKIELRDLASQDVSSTLEVTVRLKILSEAGMEQAEVAIPHTDYLRLVSFSGRTVLPGGEVVALPKDAKFRRNVSAREKVFVTSVAFPAVQVGAILDYRYEMRFDSILFLEPWYFSERIPVRHAELTYEIPRTIQARSWARDPLQAGLHNETTAISQGTRLRLWADDLPAIPNEPYGVPFGDLATQFLLVPTAYHDSYEHTRLMESWETTCALFDEAFYRPARRRTGDAKKKAKQLAAEAKGGGPRAVADALYRFVRDEISTEDLAGVNLRKDSTPDSVLKAGRGDLADKALLLQTMLEAAGIDAHLVWAADRQQGLIDLRLPNPGWFDRMIVAADLDGGRVFLDPAVPLLAFGRLLPGLEGSPALLFDPKHPEELTLPTTPSAANSRDADLSLTLDEEGVLSGEGEIVLTGHHVWSETEDGAALPRIEEAWTERLEGDFPGFRVEEVHAEGSPDAQEVRLHWTLHQREEEALGDETQLSPSRPLGPASQPFAASGSVRRSPVFMAFADADSLDLTLTWPEGWEIEALPQPVEASNDAGVFVASVEVQEESRTLHYRRRFDLTTPQLDQRGLYEDLRALFDAAQRNDGQAIALAHR